MMQLLSLIATLRHQGYVLSLLQTLFSASCKCVGSVIGRLKSRSRMKRMYKSLTPHQTPCAIQNIYSG